MKNKSNVSQEWVEVSPYENQSFPVKSQKPVRELKPRRPRIAKTKPEPDAITVNPERSCQKPCGPFDFYEGGKCDKNGCFPSKASAPEIMPGELSQIKRFIVLNVEPEKKTDVLNLLHSMEAYYALPEKEKDKIPANIRFTATNVKRVISALNLIPEEVRLPFAKLLDKAAFDASA